MTLERSIKIADEHGLHLRTAGMVARAASEFYSDITISFGEKTADAKSTLGLMTLGASNSDNILVKACGEDAESALDAIEATLS